MHKDGGASLRWVHVWGRGQPGLMRAPSANPRPSPRPERGGWLGGRHSADGLPGLACVSLWPVAAPEVPADAEWGMMALAVAGEPAGTLALLQSSGTPLFVNVSLEETPLASFVPSPPRMRTGPPQRPPSHPLRPRHDPQQQTRLPPGSPTYCLFRDSVQPAGHCAQPGLALTLGPTLESPPPLRAPFPRVPVCVKPNQIPPGTPLKLPLGR